MASSAQRRSAAASATIRDRSAGCGGSEPRRLLVASAPRPPGATGAATQPTTTQPAHHTDDNDDEHDDGPHERKRRHRESEHDRTATAPAFTEKGKTARTTGEREGLSAAEAVVQREGYTPEHPSDYHPNQTLRVLDRHSTSSNRRFGQQAFFFVDGRYIGTDATQPSAQVSVVARATPKSRSPTRCIAPATPCAAPAAGRRTCGSS